MGGGWKLRENSTHVHFYCPPSDDIPDDSTTLQSRNLGLSRIVLCAAGFGLFG